MRNVFLALIVLWLCSCTASKQILDCRQAVLNHLEDQNEIQHHTEYSAEDKLWLLAAEEDLLKMECHR